jgi:hypothetical protein
LRPRLGHRSPAFTLATYVHLLTDDLGEPLDLAIELAPREATLMATEATGFHRNEGTAASPVMAG